jgi:predicted Na+-dependent transporter
MTARIGDRLWYGLCVAATLIGALIGVLTAPAFLRWLFPGISGPIIDASVFAGVLMGVPVAVGATLLVAKETKP